MPSRDLATPELDNRLGRFLHHVCGTNIMRLMKRSTRNFSHHSLNPPIPPFLLLNQAETTKMFGKGLSRSCKERLGLPGLVVIF